MTPEAQRIKIAEACGWSDFRNCTGYRSASDKMHGKYEIIPDYPNDRNAMATAESTLDAKDWNSYEQELTRIWNQNEGGRLQRFLITCSAMTKAEAFLRTLNKWDDNA